MSRSLTRGASMLKMQIIRLLWLKRSGMLLKHLIIYPLKTLLSLPHSFLFNIMHTE